MYEIVKTYKQAIPAMRFVGVKYGDEDRVNGSYGAKWGEWFATGRFHILESLVTDDFKEIYEDYDAYIGLVRCQEGEPFHYWIGMFLPEGTKVPNGFDYIDFSASQIGVCWLYGKEPEFYGKEDECAKKLIEEGYVIDIDKNGALWSFERYGCPRFTTRDENGKVILDICHFVK